jgi:phosphohistidine phosphatase
MLQIARGHVMLGRQLPPSALGRPRPCEVTIFMRELLVLRHAKSSWDAIDAADHDRELSARGIKAAGRMGALIAERGWLPDRILCSTAKRTLETLALARKAWPAASEISTNELASLYLATPSRLLEIVRR